MPPRPRPITRFVGAAIVVSLAACSGDSVATPAAPASEPGADAQPTVVLRGQAQAGEAGGTSTYPVQVPAGQRLNSPEYAIQAFLWWRPEIAERDMLMVKDMGFHWIKQGFGWRDIEGVKGQFDWSKTDHIVGKIVEYQDLRLIVRVDHQPTWARDGCSMQGPPENLADFANFLTAVATRYKGKIAAYQIWNEPNLAREWCDQAPDPAAYAAMLKAAYQAIKAADPNALVISAGLSPTGTQPPQAMPDDTYLEQLYQAMGDDSSGYFDLLGLHAPGYAAPPETSPEEAAANPAYGGERFFTFRRVEDLRAIMERHGDAGKQVAVLEMGWTSDQVHDAYKWHAVTEEQKADYLVRAFDFAQKNWAPWISVMSVIYICDPDWTEQNEQYWWCVTNPDGSPRPAFNALKAMPKVQ